MKKFLSVILTAVILLSVSSFVFAEEKSITLTELLDIDKEKVSAIRLDLPHDEVKKHISRKDMLERFFAICDSTRITRCETTESADFNGMYITLENTEGKYEGFGYITNDGYADRYSLLMSRLPAKAYAFENAAIAQKVIDEILSLADADSIICSGWARNSVMRAEKTGISSYLDYTLPATRLEFCEMLYNTVNSMRNYFGSLQGYSSFPAKPDEQSLPTGVFIDCDSYAVMYLYDIGVVSGTSENTFSPEEGINREQVAVMAYRLAKYLNMEDFLENRLLSSDRFADETDMSEWAIDAIYQLKAVGIMEGVGEKLFAPKEAFTLEQTAVLAFKLFDKYAYDIAIAADEDVEIPKLSAIFTVSDVPKELRTFFEKESISLTCEMDALAESDEYAALMSPNEEIRTEIKKMADGNYLNPKKINIAVFDSDTTKRLIDLYAGGAVSSELYEILRPRINLTAIGKMINTTRYGSTVLAATSMISASKGYMMPKGFENTVVVVLEYDGDYASIVSFGKTGDGVISANATFVKNTQNNIMELFDVTKD